MSTTIQIAAVGDILMWGSQIRSAKVPGKDKYSFDPMFQEVAPYLRKADLTIGNFETTLSGRESAYQQQNPKTKWPMFNCPDELAGTLRRAGFNVVTTANNHCMDRGLTGLNRTLNILDKHGLHHTGTYRTQEESRQLLVENVKGIRIGILSYTYGTNLIPVPSQSFWAVNRIGLPKIRSDIQRMNREADFIIVVLHFGLEFHRYPNEKQKSIVQQAFQSGADVVLGVHPHVLQPMKMSQARNGGRKFVIYSLGNFISDRMLGNIHADSGVIVNMTVTKGSDGKAQLIGVGAIPTWVHKYRRFQRTAFRVLPTSKFLKSPDRLLTKSDMETLRMVHRNTTRHLKI